MESISDAGGDLSGIGDFLEILDAVFTSAFAAELLFNALCRPLRVFLRDGWNIFDLVTVTFSLLVLALSSNRLPVNVIRSVRALRAFRMLRLLGKLRALKNIVAALSASVVPVIYAFLIVLIVTAICAMGKGGVGGTRVPARANQGRRPCTDPAPTAPGPP